MIAPLIFVGVVNDLRTTFVDLDIEAMNPSDRARGLLAEHRSCERIEMWREDSCIAVVSRLDPDQAS